jgi:hypothetical protein
LSTYVLFNAVFEVAILEEEEQERQTKKRGSDNSSGCSVVLFLIGISLIAAGWFLILRDQRIFSF